MQKNHSEYSDSELFQRLRGEKQVAEEAFAELYNRHSSRIFAYCRRVMGDKEVARDVFQETFLQFYKSAEKEREMTNVLAFLLKIARNMCLNQRRNNRQKLVSFEEYQFPTYDQLPEKSELLQLITTSLELLPHDLREVFVLREYSGMSYTDIGEIVNASLPIVKVRIFRAKQKIREILAPYLEDLER